MLGSMKKRWPNGGSRRLYKNLQKRLVKLIDLKDSQKTFKNLLAIDVSYRGEYAYVSAVKWDLKESLPRKIYLLKVNTEFPYIRGLFFIRELPPIVSIIKVFSIEFDVLLLNAVGIAHPEGLGLTSHAGLFFKKTSIGITERIPSGVYKDPGVKKGDLNPVFNDKGNVIGFILRTQDFLKPIFVTPGHLISPHGALKLVQNLPYYSRFPEPLRIADIYSRKEFKKEIIEWCT